MSKTITLDDKAYKILKRRKLAGESFSDVIKKHMLDDLTSEELAALMEKAESGEAEKERSNHALPG